MIQLRKFFVPFLSLFTPCAVFGQPLSCSDDIVYNKLTSDLVIAADSVSFNENLDFEGKTGYFTHVKTCEYPKYDTRMRIYTSNHNLTFIVFRPTQSTYEGWSIHADRYVVPTTFLRHSKGNVHAHFQEAFEAMEMECHDAIDKLRNTTIYATGHSLGGSFALFMGAKLVYDYDIQPAGIIGFAGTFIGDEEYTVSIQTPIKQNNVSMWLIETVDLSDPSNRDATSEGYQTLDNQLDIDASMICGFYIHPLNSWESYGMHDLKNYWIAVENN